MVTSVDRKLNYGMVTVVVAENLCFCMVVTFVARKHYFGMFDFCRLKCSFSSTLLLCVPGCVPGSWMLARSH